MLLILVLDIICSCVMRFWVLELASFSFSYMVFNDFFLSYYSSPWNWSSPAVCKCWSYSYSIFISLKSLYLFCLWFSKSRSKVYRISLYFEPTFPLSMSTICSISFLISFLALNHSRRMKITVTYARSKIGTIKPIIEFQSRILYTGSPKCFDTTKLVNKYATEMKRMKIRCRRQNGTAL